MCDSEPNPCWTTLYWSAFRETAYSLIALGYERAQDQIRAGPSLPNEMAVSQFIADAIQELFLLHPGTWDGYDVKDDTPVSGGGRTGRKRKRPDIVINYTAGDRPEYWFEAKKLRNPSDIKEYTGPKGMGRFVCGDYAPKGKEVAMLGYVQKRQPDYWLNEIIQGITENEVELELEHLGQPAFTPPLPCKRVSSHRRNCLGRSILIYHILLNCLLQLPD